MRSVRSFVVAVLAVVVLAVTATWFAEHGEDEASIPTSRRLTSASAPRCSNWSATRKRRDRWSRPSRTEMNPAVAATAHYLARRVLQQLDRTAQAALQFELLQDERE